MHRVRRLSYWTSVSSVALMLILPGPVPGHEGETHDAVREPSATPGATDASPRADIEERLGSAIPAGLAFVDADGRACDLPSTLTRPTILVLAYYGCTAECNAVLDSLASTLREVPRKPGADYQVVSVSVDDTETPAMAGRKRDTVMRLLGPTFPRDAWRFLVGDGTNIAALTRAVGFHFIRQERGIIHSTALVFIAPGGQIVRYLHGTRYLPAEISLALAEAERGQAGVSTRKMLSYCFSYDPASRRYTADILRVAGLAITASLVILLLVMLRPRRNRKHPPANNPGKD